MYKKIFINILVILLITTGIILLITFFWKIQSSKITLDNMEIQNIDNQALEVKQPENKLPPKPAAPEPKNLLRHEGILTQINDNKISLSTIFGEKTVDFTDSTVFKKVFAAKFPPIPGQTSQKTNLPKPENISLQNLAVGQQVEVIAAENISGQNRFTAAEINLLVKVN